MTWGSLLSYIRLRCPEVSQSSVVSDANILIITNLVCSEFLDATEALPTYKDFNCVANQQVYSISTNITDFMRMDKMGVWWYDSVNKFWKELKPRTLEWIIEVEPTWINRDAGAPLYYWQQGDDIGLHPKPDTSYASGIRCYYFKQSVDMSSTTHYPFSGSTTQYPFLKQYDETIVDGVRYKILQMVGKANLAEEAKLMFFTKCSSIKGFLKERVDLVREGPRTRKSNEANNPMVYS
jgi:hypothetical protein